MEIEFHYIRRITGLLAGNSKTEATKKVRETGRFQILEIDDGDAPVAYRESHTDGTVLTETRWYDGSHWHVTDSVPPGDGKGMVVGIPDYDLMYGDLVKPEDNISHGSAFHGYVDANKKWFKVTSDDAVSALEKATKHFTENTAVIGGKFALRVLEPSLKFSLNRANGTPPYEAHLTTAFRATSENRRWYHEYGLSLNEYAEAVETLISAANMDALVKPPRLLTKHQILIEEAFSKTLVEPASRKVIEDGLSLAEGCMSEFDLKTKVAFVVMRDAISRNGRLTLDTAQALEKFNEFGDVLAEAKMKKNQRQNLLLFYTKHDIRVTAERYEEMQSVDKSYDTTEPRLPVP